ncbi:MAG: class I SAM-dependent methyltransferase [Chloroflexales bacterium]|nr:class I SAM-dependent methyltransferase [Chloroflexales bacterium]
MRHSPAGGRLFGNLTEQLLRRAGLTPGMRVLNIGCGTGDVAFLAAALVGPTGHVLGVDRNPAAAAVARRQAASAGLTNVDIVVDDVNTFAPSAPVDALIGRFALASLNDPAATLRRLSGFVRPGGVIAFQEIRLGAAAEQPALSFAAAFRTWSRDSSRWADLAIDTGSQLFTLFLQAGLSAPLMLLGAWADVEPDAPAHTPAARLQHEVGMGGDVLLPALVGAWTYKA